MSPVRLLIPGAETPEVLRKLVRAWAHPWIVERIIETKERFDAAEKYSREDPDAEYTGTMYVDFGRAEGEFVRRVLGL